MEKKGKSIEMENNFHFLDECILEILLRLPVKPLMRFKCVSKKWFSLISNPKFAKLHFDFSANRSHQLICYKDSKLQFIDPETLFHDNPPRTVNQVFPTQIMLRNPTPRSCRGFVLLAAYSEFILWNPSIGTHKRISYSHVLSGFDICNPYCDAYLYGFGYDASMDDYLIVVAWYEDSGEKHLEYFSLRTNSWTKLDPLVLTAPVDPELPLECKVGSFLNGAIHWFGCTDNNDSIIAFDLIERSFSGIKIPKFPIDTVSADLSVVGGFLTMTYIYFDDGIDDEATEFWVMKTYKVQSSWVKYQLNKDLVKPIYMAKCGDIVGLDDSGRVVKYNEKGELLEHSIFPYYRYWDSIVLHNESMLSLPSHTGEAEEDGQL